jgi:adsorption protein B
MNIDPEKMNEIHQQPEKNLAIIVAAWHEAGVLEKMIRGNLNLIQYQQFTFYLGVYPNDVETMQEALNLARKFPNVVPVINTRPGPTSKGQMINEVINFIFAHENKTGGKHDGFIIQDSEDIMSPHSLKIMNWQLSEYDFVQIPVFSFAVAHQNWIAGTYIDEFAETHTHDLLVRSFFKVPIPSAGVGTALSRKLVTSYYSELNSQLLNERTLTEDYELGVSTGKFGLTSTFGCFYTIDSTGRRSYIATREYFPKSFSRSIRQKTRWTLGVALQGWANLGWHGNWVSRYFLYRDRRSLPCNLLGGFGLFVFFYSFVRLCLDTQYFFPLAHQELLTPLMLSNAAMVLHRLIIRAKSVYSVYGLSLAVFSIFRIPISNLINFVAAFNALFQYFQIRFLKKEQVWIKTEHELPADFGQTLPSELSARMKEISPCAEL